MKSLFLTLAALWILQSAIPIAAMLATNIQLLEDDTGMYDQKILFEGDLIIPHEQRRIYYESPQTKPPKKASLSCLLYS